MNAIVLGSQGQLGMELARAKWPANANVRFLARAELDITSRPDVRRMIGQADRTVVINAAAYTAVDRAESEPDLAFSVNRDGVACVAEACAAANVPLIHVSTDYVFDGTLTRPYVESDWVNPLNVYGQSKAAGEDALRKTLEQHIILRTSWLYSVHGTNFVKAILRAASERPELRVVADQHGCPTAARDLAEAIIHVATAIPANSVIAWGTYHYAGTGEATWLELAESILGFADAHPKLTPVTTAEYGARAARPRNSRLDSSGFVRAFGLEPPPWRTSLHHVVMELLNSESAD